MTTYPVGGFFVVALHGPVGWAIRIGQALAGRPSPYQHAGMIVTSDGRTVEAHARGARTGHLAAYTGRPLLICDAPIRALPADRQAAARARVADETRRLIGTPYSFLDYLALALLHLGLPSRWVRQRVESSGHLICSALVDLAMHRAGIELYNDGRLPGDVMPADLAALAETAATRNGNPTRV